MTAMMDLILKGNEAIDDTNKIRFLCCVTVVLMRKNVLMNMVEDVSGKH